MSCLLYTSDAADDTPCVDLGGYDCQFTVRSEDEPGIDTLKKVPSILAELEKLGACGELSLIHI